MANKITSEKNKPARKTLRPNEYYNPKTKRYEYHYKDCFGKERVISSYRLEITDQLPKGKKSSHTKLTGKEDYIIKDLIEIKNILNVSRETFNI